MANFNAAEIIVLVFILAGLAKMLIVLFSRKSWTSVVKSLYSKPMRLMIIEFVLAIIVLYYLLQSLSLVQVMAGVVFGALLTGMVFAAYTKELMPPILKILKKNAWKKAWLPITVWIILIIWTIGELFGFM